MSSDFDRGLLELEECVAEVIGNTKLVEPGSCLLRQVIRRFDVNVVRGDRFRPRPTIVNDIDKLGRDVVAEVIRPTVLEPAGELLAGIVVEHIDIQLALLREARQRQVAAAEIAHPRTDEVLATEQIQLGVKRVAKEELDDEFP